MCMGTAKKTVGFIGLGIMGKSMAGHILKAGYPLVVFNRTKEKANELLEQGAEWVDSPAEVASKADIVMTMVGFPNDVEDVYLGDNGLFSRGREGSYFIDFTTSSPTLAKKLYDEGKKRGIHVLDAPVSGGDIGAKNAKLSIMVGGDQEAFESVYPLLELLGNNINYMGTAGAGQHTKMANQIAIATNMIGVCEALVYAKKAELDVQKVFDTISTGAAGSFSLSSYGPRIIKEDYSPGFFIKHFIKDMTIALNEAEKMGIEFPGLALAKKMYEQLAREGEENSGTQALIKYWKDW